mmetsp:Transcript_33327/g.54246  ORF Transcript_33327/g.54246 Transcript_33327/m.54246 type:complete len:90 (-) Transcript_33327:214-483(-)
MATHCHLFACVVQCSNKRLRHKRSTHTQQTCTRQPAPTKVHTPQFVYHLSLSLFGLHLTLIALIWWLLLSQLLLDPSSLSVLTGQLSLV